MTFRNAHRSAGLVVLLLFAAAAGCGDQQANPGELVDQAVQRYSEGDLPGAEKAVCAALAEHPHNPALLVMAGEIALGSGKTDEATKRYLRAVAAGLDSESCHRVADGLSRQGAVFPAITVLEAALAKYPDSAALRHQIAVTLAAVGNEWDAATHFQRLADDRQIGLDGLIVLSDRTRPHSQVEICQLALESHPEDLRPVQGIARRFAYLEQWEEVRERLEPVVAQHPDYLPAQLTFGRALVELGDAHKVSAWSKQLPSSAPEHPDYWLSLGIWTNIRGEHRAAARAFSEALRRDPNLSEALHHLGALLLEIGREEEANQCARRARLLSDVRQQVDNLIGWQGQSQRAAVSLARSMVTLDRPAEAAGWAHLAKSMQRDPVDDFDAVLTELQQSSSRATVTLDLRELPLPSWNRAERSSKLQANRSRDASSPEAVPQIQLADEARSRGIDFQFENGDDPTEPGMWLHQSNGGGIAVVDFDCDGWPDLYFGNAGGKPHDPQGSLPNRLYRNHAGQFVDVTPNAAVGSRAYTQGVSAGDYNEDGFPDLLVANIGRNQLLRNNGDGTFTDVTDQVGLTGSRWTTSVAIADLDGDAIPDLVEVNYVAGQLPFEQQCTIREIGEPRACPPTVFDAQRDFVYRGLGDGSFEDATSRWLAGDPLGYGLGLLVARFDGSPGLALFVANDMSANHYWKPAQGPDASFMLRESAGVHGLAFDDQSRVQACMGVAFGDPDRDGDFDLLVTNFHGESNAYYEQLRPGIWADRSRAAGLVEPSMEQLGFGTEFLDLDADGQLELIVTNGHVDDMRFKGAGFAMPTQVFHQRGGRWAEIPSHALGDFFEQPHIGRNLVACDINRDGLADAAVSHLQEPVAVLVNRTPATGNRLVLDFRGVKNARDAIGTIVRVRTKRGIQTAQVTAGDGYQCSNERRLLFGLADAEVVERLDVEWPDGSSQHFEQLPAGQHLLVIEGRDEPVLLEKLER